MVGLVVFSSVFSPLFCLTLWFQFLERGWGGLGKGVGARTRFIGTDGLVVFSPLLDTRTPFVMGAGVLAWVGEDRVWYIDIKGVPYFF